MKCIEATGLKVAANHGYTPHITLAWLPAECPTPAVKLPDQELSFDQFYLAWGDTRMPFKLKKELPADGDGKNANRGRDKKSLAGRAGGQEIKFEFKIVGNVGNKETIYNGQTGFFIEGWASVRAPEDRYGDLIGPTSQVFRAAVEKYFTLNPILLYEHGLDQVIGNKPLGQVVQYRFDDAYGLWVKAFVRKPIWAPLLQVYEDIKNGILRTFSIGGLWVRQGNQIVEADLVEISVVATPAQAYAVFDVATKSFGKNGKEASGTGTLALRCLLAIKLAMAGVEYWTEQARALLKLKESAYRNRALRATARRIKRATDLMESLLSPGKK